MVQTLQASKVKIATLKSKFGLVKSQAPQFFMEWVDPDITVTDAEIQALARAQSNFEYLLEDRPLLEEAVRMVILSPLLDLAGFYQPPFRIEPETFVSIEATDEEGVVIRGEIDVLVVLGELWVLVIESKMTTFALQVALPQALSYMLANPIQPCFGLITNGNDFMFLKLNREGRPQYATSKVFSLSPPGNELVEVLKVLKHLGQFIVNPVNH